MLQALNSGDREVVGDYIARYGRGESVDDVLRVARQTGRLDLVEIVASEPLRLQFIVRSAAANLRLLGILEVENADPARVTFSLPWTPVPPGASVIGFDVDATARARVVATVAEKLRQLYVLPEPATEMAESLMNGLRTGGYDGLSNGWSFANELTEDLRRIKPDLHLFVGFSPIAGGPAMPTPSVARPRPVNPSDCGFERVEMLDGNVGYIKISELADPARCGTKAADVLRSIGGARAVIFDLRDTLGGNAGMSMLLYAQLFDSPARVSAVQRRDSAQAQELRWAERVGDVRLTTAPVYVLTSAQTFSGAEAFAYDLQVLQRASIVGETTKGGAHMPQIERIDERFVLSVPRARAVNPITGTNWEGVGVRPDVAVPAGDALPTALRLAR
ncbi:MAG TPA: S41 family peptidase, partial [Rhodanobacteraceae bacterium]|nr:S41 family peptidase [Rhodanobacteraceae bacterium]